MLIGAHEVIASGLRRSVGTVRGERSLFCERRIILRQRPVHFVGRDMQKAKSAFLRFRERVPIKSDRIEETKRADDVRLDKGLWRINRTVYVGFSGEIEDTVALMLFQQITDQLCIADIAMNKNVTRIARQIDQVGGIARIGQ